MFPEMQEGPHKAWDTEVKYLDQLFENGSAYTVGPMNGDHWLLYLTSPSPFHESYLFSPMTSPTSSSTALRRSTSKAFATRTVSDQTLEILMTDLPDNTCSNFFKDPLPSCLSEVHDKEGSRSCHDLGSLLSQQLKIDEIHPAETHQTILDSYLFEPCGFSVNGFVRARSNPGEDDKRWEFVPERKKDPGEGIDQTLGNERGNLALSSDEEEDEVEPDRVRPSMDFLESPSIANF